MPRAGACLWLVFVALAVSACQGDTATGDPNQPAGKVIELAGQVSAAREGAPDRPLAVGAPVFADDTVTTGTDGSAVIMLAHNQVRWSLGQGKSQRVDRSMAWKATADEGGSAFDDEEKMATASAGRHTDREAGDTAATAQLPQASEAAPAAPAPGEAVATTEKPPAPPARPKRLKQEANGAAEGGLLANKSAKGDSVLDEPSGGGGGSAGRAPAAAIAPSAPASGDAETAPAQKATTTRGASAGVRLVLGKLTVKGALSPTEVGSRFSTSFAQSCRGTVAGTVTLRFDIDASGAVKNVRLTGSSPVVAPISACVSSAARALSFPAAAGGGTTTVERAITLR